MTKREALEALIREIQTGLRSSIVPKKIIKSQIATGAPESLVRKVVELAVRYNAVEDEIILIGLNAKKP